MRTDPVTNLGIHDTEVLARFLLHHMDMDTRRKLRAEMPLIYARAFPTVGPAVLGEAVTAAIESERGK